jgi:hypothetical protein
MRLSSFLVFGGSIVLAGCGGTTEASKNTSTASPSATAEGPAPATQEADAEAPRPTPTATPVPTATGPVGACSGIVDDGPNATARMVAAAAPAETGGPIADGKYHLVDITLYTGPTGAAGPLPITVSTTFVVKGNVVHAAAHGPDGAIDKTDTIVTSGTSITFTESCPTTGKGGKTATYSADSNDVVVFMKNDIGQTSASKYSRVK